MLNKKYFLILIFQLCITYVFSQQLQNDSKLNELQKKLPDKWLMKIENNQLQIFCTDSVWAMYENKISMECRMESEEQRIKKIKSNGKKTRPCMLYKLEPKWSQNKIDESKKINEQIAKDIENFSIKTGVSKLIQDPRTTKGELWFNAKNQNDSLLVKKYLEYKKSQEQKIIQIPDYCSNNFSLFKISITGIDDAFTTVYPFVISENGYKIFNLLNDILK